MQQWVDGKLLKTAQRPPNDQDPEHPGLTVVTRTSFDEICLNQNNEVFLDIYADWCGPCVAFKPTLFKIAEILKDSSVIVAKFDSDKNEKVTEFMPETSIPTFKWFPKGEKKWVNYSGERTVSAVMEWIKVHSSAVTDAHIEEAKLFSAKKDLLENYEQLNKKIVQLKSFLTSEEENT